MMGLEHEVGQDAGRVVTARRERLTQNIWDEFFLTLKAKIEFYCGACDTYNLTKRVDVSEYRDVSCTTCGAINQVGVKKVLRAANPDAEVPDYEVPDF